MYKELNVKVGDFVLYKSGHPLSKVEKIIKVTKVTPTGRIRIEGYDEQYDKYGNQMGNHDRWYGGSSIRIPTEEDYKRIKENSAISKALSLVKKLNKENLPYDLAVEIIKVLESEEKE